MLLWFKMTARTRMQLYNPRNKDTPLKSNQHRLSACLLSLEALCRGESLGLSLILDNIERIQEHYIIPRK